MTIRKTIWLTALIILPIFSAHAQRFDWVKTYSGQDPFGGGYANEPVGIVHDSQGNIYYLGHFGVGAGIDTTHFLPFAPSGPGINTSGTVIAKFSPSGEMLWHKIIYSNNGQHTSAYQIQMLGDSAIVCLVEFTQPDGASTYTYFIDTLLTEYGNYFIDNDSIDIGRMSALLTFDLNGELLERHMMQTAFFDTTDALIMSFGKTRTNALGAHHFCIDNSGHIILIRTAQDYVTYTMTVSEGTITGLRFIIDGHRYFDFHPQGHPQQWEHQILKFSPHFNDLMFAEYFIEPSDWHTITTLNSVNFSSLVCDTDGSFCITGTIKSPSCNIPVTNDSSFIIRSGDKPWHGFLLKYQPSGELLYLKQIDYSENAESRASTSFGGAFFADGNLFIPADANSYSSPNTANFIIDDSLLNYPSGICFIRCNANTGQFLSFGGVTSNNYCDINAKKNKIAAYNNRVAFNTKYRGDIYFHDSLLAPGLAPSEGSGLVILDYDGNLLQYIDYNTRSTNDKVCYTSFHDSSLYITLQLNGSATLGENNVYYQGNSTAVLARYVDTAFLTPYRYDNDNNGTDSTDVSILSIGNDSYILIYPNPVQTELHISSIREPIVSAYISSVNGCRKQVPLKNNTIDFRAFEPGVYFLEIITKDNNNYSAKVIKK